MTTGLHSPSGVVITGSSTGIGAACALALDKRGFRVFAGVRSLEDGRRLKEQASDRLTPVIFDVTDEPSIAAAAAEVGEVLGDAGLAGLVNNAGIVVPGPLEIVPLDKLRLQFDVNVIGQIAVTQAFLPLLRAGKGRIVNMSSISGLVAPPFLGPYAASKFALEALSDALRSELRKWGISVSVIEPGNVATPIWEKTRTAAEKEGQTMPPEAVALYQEDMDAVRKTTQRFGENAMPVERVVRAVVHALCSRRPKIRYPVGGQTRLAAWARKWIPDRIRDWYIRRELGLR